LRASEVCRLNFARRAEWHICAELEQAYSAAMAVLGWGMLLLTGVAAGFGFVIALPG
jgi:hypothetical protein